MFIERRRIWAGMMIIAGGMLMTGVVCAQSPTVQPDLPSFGLVGIAPTSQFVRLNVTNVRVVGLSFLAPRGKLSVGPCTASLILSDDSGKTLKRSHTRLEPGQSTSLELTASYLRAVSTAAGRIELLPAVQRDGGCILTPSVEVIATATNQTDAYVLRKGANGNGFLPSYGLVGMALASQFIRFNVSNQAIPGTPRFGDCDVLLRFSDAKSRPIKQSNQIRLALGTSTQLDLTAADVPPGLAGESRVEVIPSLESRGTCALNSSVEVISAATGETDAYAADSVLSTNH